MKHPVYDTDKHFTIDLTTRTLISEMKKISLVKHTHNSERFTFKFPRAVEGHDLSLCDKAEVHFLNIDAATKETSKGTYAIEDVQVDEEDSEKITFSWLIDGRASEYVGTLHFSIHFKCEENGKLLYKWPTATFNSILISDGVDNGEMEMQEYNDIVTAWMHEIEANIGETVKAAVDELVGDAVDQAVGEKVEPAVDKAIADALQGSALDPSNYANALKGNASGTELVIDDLSPLASKVKVRAVGMQPQTRMMMRSAAPTATGDEQVNLMPFSYHFAQPGQSITDEYTGTLRITSNPDGTITLEGRAPSSNNVEIILYRNTSSIAPFETNKYYTRYKGDTDKYYFYLRYYRGGDTSADYVFLGNADGASAMLPQSLQPSGLNFYILVKAGVEFTTPETIYPMIVEGQSEEIPSYVSPSDAESGGDDGEHTHESTAGAHVCKVCGEVLSQCEDGDKDHVCDVCGAPYAADQHKDNDGDGFCDYCGQPIENSGVMPTTVTIRTASADDPDTIVETRTTAPGATVELTPIFPRMLITTDSSEVIISAEYNRDTNKVIEELSQRIGEGGGGDLTEAAKEEVRAYVDDAILGGAW